MKYYYLWICLITGLPLSLSAQLSSSTAQKVDDLFSEFRQADPLGKENNDLGTPGCALAIVQDGELIYSKGYGMADLEHGIPISPRSVFYAGSVSKQFVATCILLLREEGKLSLEDDIRQYFPKLPDYGAPITIRHLIHHISGLRDYLDLWDLSGRDMLEYMADEAVMDLIQRQEALNFSPGERYSYSNSGYFLLKEIIKKVSGQSLREYASEHIFEPLGMADSHFHDDLYHLIARRAFGYRHGEEGRIENLIMRFDLVGSGGLYTTVEDLYKWDQNFYKNRLGRNDQSLIDTLETSGRLLSGESAGYAFAMRPGTYRGLRTISHTGSMGGYRAYYLRLPDQRFSVILLGNFEEFTPVSYAQRVVDLLLEPRLNASTSFESEAGLSLFHLTFSEEELQAAPGHYYSPELDARAEITKVEDELYLQIGYRPPFAIREWMRRADNRGIEFMKNEGSPFSGFLLHSGVIRDIRFERR